MRGGLGGLTGGTVNFVALSGGILGPQCHLGDGHSTLTSVQNVLGEVLPQIFAKENLMSGQFLKTVDAPPQN
jgi:hypothetical protein